MRKNNNWSILLWSIFLLMFISFSFLYISTQIKQKIKSNNNNFFQNTSEEITRKFENSFTWTVKKGEKLYFSFDAYNTWTILLLDWWPVYCEIYSGSILSSSKVVTSFSTINTLSWVYLSTLWWFSKFNITFSWSTWINFPYNFLETTKNIWENIIVKEINLEK